MLSPTDAWGPDPATRHRGVLNEYGGTESVDTSNEIDEIDESRLTCN